MSEPNNGQSLSPEDNRILAPKGSQARYTGELLLPQRPKTVGNYTGDILLRTRPKTSRKIVDLLAHPDWSDLRISQACKVSRNSINAIKQRECATIEQRKNELAMMLSDVVHIGTARVADTIGRAKVRDAIIGTGVAVDKLLALSGQAPVAVGVVVMPSEQDRENMRALDQRLDEIAKRLVLNTPKVVELPQGE
jgi:hypothetical protein